MAHQSQSHTRSLPSGRLYAHIGHIRSPGREAHDADSSEHACPSFSAGVGEWRTTPASSSPPLPPSSAPPQLSSPPQRGQLRSGETEERSSLMCSQPKHEPGCPLAARLLDWPMSSMPDKPCFRPFRTPFHSGRVCRAKIAYVNLGRGGIGGVCPENKCFPEGLLNAIFHRFAAAQCRHLEAFTLCSHIAPGRVMKASAKYEAARS